MTLLSEIYDVTLKRGNRGSSKNNYIRPTIGEFFMTHRDFKQIQRRTFVPTTWDPVRKAESVTLSNDNKTAHNIVIDKGIRTVFDGVTSGKYYWEIYIENSSFEYLGIYSIEGIGEDIYPTGYPGAVPFSMGYYYVGGITGMDGGGNYYNKSAESYGTGDTIGFALDCENLDIKFYKNGIYQNSLSIFSASKQYFPGGSTGSSSYGSIITARFSQEELQYTVPNGFTPGFGELV